MGLFDPSVALDAADAAFGTAATYTPPVPGAAAQGIVVIAGVEDAELSIGPARGRTMRGMFEVRRSVLAAPVKDGVVRHNGIAWQIVELPSMEDPDRLVWTLRCQVAAGP
jgi:hypothetical protein